MDSLNVQNPLAQESLFRGPIIQHPEALQSTYKTFQQVPFTTFYPNRMVLGKQKLLPKLSPGNHSY